MKVDTQALIKNRFWLLTGGCVLLALLALIVLGTSVASTIRARQELIEGEIKKTETFGDPKRPTEVAYKTKEAELHKALEDITWAKAYEKQKFISTWPE